jgi:transcriptional regulator with XRE-family HTH domain
MPDSHPLSLNQQLAFRAKTFCSNLGLTQATLARLLSVDDSQFSRFVNGQANLSSEKTLKLVRLMSLSKRDLELKFGSPEKLSGRLMHLQEGGRELAKVVRFSNDGWIAKEGGTDDPNNTTDITSSNYNPARSCPDDEELEFLSGLAGLHQSIIDKINAWQQRSQKAKPNKDGATEAPRRITDNDDSRRSGPRGDLFR